MLLVFRPTGGATFAMATTNIYDGDVLLVVNGARGHGEGGE